MQNGFFGEIFHVVFYVGEVNTLSENVFLILPHSPSLGLLSCIMKLRFQKTGDMLWELWSLPGSKKTAKNNTSNNLQPDMHPNETQLHPSSFLLLGIPGLEDMHIWIGFPFLAVYLIALWKHYHPVRDPDWNRSLHQPMFYFLAMLAFTDLGCPQPPSQVWASSGSISGRLCLVLASQFTYALGLESVVQPVMAIDPSHCHLQPPEECSYWSSPVR